MILVDANILVYAVQLSSPDHRKANEWLTEQLNRPGRVGLPWPSLLSFVRLITNPRIFTEAVPVDVAWRQVEKWLDSPTAWIPQPTDRHRETLGDLMPYVRKANHVPDAHLAAIAIEHGLTLCTADGDFARFPRLRCFNPLLAR